jgi:BirA family biotin operon repressor/biotin-[acetyl-CoA-carboxylase] ligase
MTGLPARVKWPNDVLVNGRKIAGILTECSTDAARSLFAVVGIGLNVNHEAMPPELADRAASIRQLTGRPLDRAAVAAALIEELASRLPEVDGAFDRILAEAARRSTIIGGWIRLDSSGSVLEGTAEGLDAEGNLVLRLADGSLRTVTAGEVTSQTPSRVPDRK